MSLVSGVVANLISGVSQQPPPARAEGTTAHCVNAIPSVVTGLRKRPSSQIVAPLFRYGGGSVAMHILDRGTRTASRIFLGTTSGLRVFTLDGKEERVVYSPTPGQPVNQAARQFTDELPEYLSGLKDPESTLGFSTIADTAYVFNRSVPVRMKSLTKTPATTTTTPSPVVSTKPPADFTQATIEASDSYLSSYDAPSYKLYINNNLVSTVTLPPTHVWWHNRPRYYYNKALAQWLAVLRNHVDFRYSEIINGVLHIRSSTIVISDVSTSSSRRYTVRKTPHRPHCR